MEAAQCREGSSVCSTRRRRGRLPGFLRRRWRAEVEAGCGNEGDSGGGAMAGLAGTVASAPWGRDERPSVRRRRHVVPLGVTLRRRPVPFWGFPSAHPRGHPCPVSRDCPVWPQPGPWVSFPGPRASQRTPGSRSGLQGQCSPVCSRDGTGRVGECGAEGRDYHLFSPGARGRGPSF